MKRQISTHWSATGGLSVSSRSWCSSSLLNKADSLFQLLVPAPCIWTPNTHTHTGSKVKVGKHLGGFRGSVEQWSSLTQTSLLILQPLIYDIPHYWHNTVVRPYYNLYMSSRVNLNTFTFLEYKMSQRLSWCCQCWHTFLANWDTALGPSSSCTGLITSFSTSVTCNKQKEKQNKMDAPHSNIIYNIIQMHKICAH